jgi:hypothetical protein
MALVYWKSPVDDPIIGATGGTIPLLGRLGHPVVVLSAGLFLYSLGESRVSA